MAKRRKQMPRGRGWKLTFNGKSVSASLLLKKRMSDQASIAVFKVRTPKSK